MICFISNQPKGEHRLPKDHRRVVLDLDENNRVTGIEIEVAGKLLDLSGLELRALPVVNLVLTQQTYKGEKLEDRVG